MKTADPFVPFSTHQVLNQVAALPDYNAFASDRALSEAVVREGAGWAQDRLRAFGGVVGSERVRALAAQADRNPPELHTHDRIGNRIDQVEFHPAYHELMSLAFGAGTHSLAWTADRQGAHVARAALSFLWNQAENGTACPVAMSFAALPVLRRQPDIAKQWEPRLVAAAYDPRPLPPAQKAGVTIGMALTEKQGGSDLRAITTQAHPAGPGGPGGEYRITGHKWFCSAPMSDAFLVLAATEKGPSCFLVPRSLPDGRRNPFFIQRLKDKCGNRANASSEVEFSGTHGWMVGEEGRGIRILVEMAHFTRLECTVGSAAIMRQALVQALHHTAHRQAFSRRLAEHPLMRNVLADLALESEAATVLAMRLARAFDESEANETQRAVARLATPVGKYWICKRLPAFVAEAMECHGGSGYVEESPLARLYREAPLNGIWEGSGNVICLDVLRALGREQRSLDAIWAEIDAAHGADPRLDGELALLKDTFSRGKDLESQARRLVERLALTLQAALLVRNAPSAVAEAFCATRLGDAGGRTFGTLPSAIGLDELVARAQPAP
ncbi:MAG: acyl-CoA dehydrogenase family protein [SAR324 cluster bacterium]